MRKAKILKTCYEQFQIAKYKITQSAHLTSNVEHRHQKMGKYEQQNSKIEKMYLGKELLDISDEMKRLCAGKGLHISKKIQLARFYTLLVRVVMSCELRMTKNKMAVSRNRATKYLSFNT